MANQLTPEAVDFVNRLMRALSPKSPWVQERVKMIFANPTHTAGNWSTHDENGRFVDCESDTLRGRIAQLWHKREEDGKISWFLKVKCEDGYSYVIHSRHDRVFSRNNARWTSIDDGRRNSERNHYPVRSLESR